jgi:transcriptional regulator with XRE-family HTH domain
MKRLARSMTQAAVAEKVGVAVSAINKYELDKRRPSPEVAQQLGVLLDFDWTIFYKGNTAS